MATHKRRGMGLVGRTVIFFSVVGAVAVALVVMLLVTLNSIQDTGRLRNQVDITADVVEDIERILVEMTAAEEAFFTSGNTAHLGVLTAAIDQIPELTGDLGDHQSDPSLTEPLAAVIEAASSYTQNWLEVVPVVAATDPVSAIELLGTGDGIELASELRRTITGYEDAQEFLFAERRRRADAAVGQAVTTTYFLLGGVLLALAGSVVVTYLTITRPLRALMDATKRFAEGDRWARAEVAGLMETKELATAFNDMADSVEATRANLAYHAAELRAVLNSTADAVIVTDLDGRIAFTNATADKMFPPPLTLDHMAPLGEVFERLAKLTSPHHWWEEVRQRIAVDPESEVATEFTVDATGQAYVGYTTPVQLADGEPIGRIFAARDITMEREAEIAKEQFVATVSHELRTPLTSILGYLDLVLEDPAKLDEQQARFLAVVRRNAQRLLELVSDLLTVSQIQSRRLAFDMKRTDLAAVVADAVQTARPHAETKHLDVGVTKPEHLWIEGDRVRLVDMLGNLLSNAMKFTPEGGRVEVSLEETDGMARIEVADSGIGIDPEDQEKIFDRFFRATTALEASVPGTGLGLAICKAVTEGHDGTIRVSSTVGEGTTFTIELPVRERLARRS